MLKKVYFIQKVIQLLSPLFVEINTQVEKLLLKMEQIMLPSIWSGSPCTLPYSNRAPSFQKSPRFEVNSIYYKDDPHKPKNQQSILSRPEMILHEFRKKIKEATKNYQSAVLKKKKSEQHENKSSIMNVKASQVTGRLYRGPHNILLMKYDFNGNRSSFIEDVNQNEKQMHQHHKNLSPKQLKEMRMHHKSCDNVYITGTLRTDFGKPLNFHPGPGSYFITEDQNGSFIKSRLSGNPNENIHERKITDMSKTLFSEKSHVQQTSLKKSFEHISKKYSTVEVESSPERRKNLVLKKMKFFNKKD